LPIDEIEALAPAFAERQARMTPVAASIRKVHVFNPSGAFGLRLRGDPVAAEAPSARDRFEQRRR
jgi:hypothetical protein